MSASHDKSHDKRVAWGQLRGSPQAPRVPVFETTQPRTCEGCGAALPAGSRYTWGVARVRQWSGKAEGYRSPRVRMCGQCRPMVALSAEMVPHSEAPEEGTTLLPVYVPYAYIHDPARGTLGVLIGRHIWAWEMSQASQALNRPPEVYTLPESYDLPWLAQRTAERTIDTLLILRGWPDDTALVAGWPRGVALDAPEGYTLHPLTARGGLGENAGLAGVVVQPERGGLITQMILPQVQDVWGLASDCKRLADLPPALAAATLAAAWAGSALWLGVKWRYSPSYTGMQLLRLKLGEWQRRGHDLSGPGDLGRSALAMPSPLMWARDPEGIPAVGTLYRYDRNWAYVTAARDVPLGSPRVTDAYQPGCQGVYVVDAEAPATWPAHVPGLFKAAQAFYPREVRAVSAWHPQIERALALGWSVRVHQGVYWPREQTHDLLRAWQDSLWKARRVAAAKATDPNAGRMGEIAGHLIKLLGVATIGRLRQKSARQVVTLAELTPEQKLLDIETDPSGAPTGIAEVAATLGRDDLYRPEWWACIIARAAERVQAATYTHLGAAVAAWYVDEVHSLNPAPALDGPPTKAGGWHHKAPDLLADYARLSGGPVGWMRYVSHAGRMAGERE